MFKKIKGENGEIGPEASFDQKSKCPASSLHWGSHDRFISIMKMIQRQVAQITVRNCRMHKIRVLYSEVFCLKVHHTSNLCVSGQRIAGGIRR